MNNNASEREALEKFLEDMGKDPYTIVGLTEEQAKSINWAGENLFERCAALARKSCNGREQQSLSLPKGEA